MFTLGWSLTGFAVGYVLAIYTWTPLRTYLINGIEVEAADLRVRAKALEEKIKAKLKRK